MAAMAISFRYQEQWMFDQVNRWTVGCLKIWDPKKVTHGFRIAWKTMSFYGHCWNPTGGFPVGTSIVFIPWQIETLVVYRIYWWCIWFRFSGWWFGTCLFYHILGIVTPTDFHILQMGRYTTNQIVYGCNSEKTNHFRLIKASKNSIFDAPPRRQDFCCREKPWSRQLGSDSWGEDAVGKRWLGQLWMGKWL